MLNIRGLNAGYGGSQVLFGIELSIERGEVVTLLGRNGMGKTTTIRSILGMIRPQGGSITFDDREIVGLPAFRVARLGIGLVPEGRMVFPNLTVLENLKATAANRLGYESPWTLEKVLELFPALSQRMHSFGRLLSGGEQQMVAIGRALLTNPKLLILDEATEGLAPLIRDEIWACLKRVKAAGQAILVTDKNIKALVEVADRHYFIERGRVVHECDTQTLLQDTALSHRYLGV